MESIKILMRLLPVLVGWLILTGCEAMMYQPTPIAIVITATATPTSLPTETFTPAPTRTPAPTATPDVTATPTPFPCDQTAGQLLEFNDNLSDIASENLRYLVYVPPCYLSSQRRFPLAILLHGLSYREQQWSDLGLVTLLDEGITAGTVPPMIVVMPYMGTIGGLNQFPPDPSYERVILEELLPQVERNFCIWQDRDYRAIGGISRGGFWAYSIAMRHPDTFSIVGGHSAFFPSDTNEIPPAFNPLELARNSAALPEADLRLYLDTGAEDSAGPSQQSFSARLTARGIQHTYVVHPTGEHNNDYWSQHVDEYLTFYARDWMLRYGDLPACNEPSPGT